MSPVPKAGNVRKLHKAFIRYHDPNNWPMLREALKKMGRADLIGSGKKHLVPAWQPILPRDQGKDNGSRRPAGNKPVAARVPVTGRKPVAGHVSKPARKPGRP